jgi:hypothetical protein
MRYPSPDDEKLGTASQTRESHQVFPTNEEVPFDNKPGQRTAQLNSMIPHTTKQPEEGDSDDQPQDWTGLVSQVV